MSNLFQFPDGKVVPLPPDVARDADRVAMVGALQSLLGMIERGEVTSIALLYTGDGDFGSIVPSMNLFDLGGLLAANARLSYVLNQAADDNSEVDNV